MINNPSLFDFERLEVIVVYKHSRWSYAKQHGSKKEQSGLLNTSDPITRDLIIAHENNLRCIESVNSTLTQMGVKFEMLCRSDLDKTKAKNKFVISVGGDGTLLDTSHYCEDSPVLGVNSDPGFSIGALCVASASSFRHFLTEIYQGKLVPSPLTRLLITIDGQQIEPLALNDVLFCHKNPAAMSRFVMSLKDDVESHRASGVWVATAAGSTGGIYSSGGDFLPIEADLALFRLREPYWTDKDKPNLVHGRIQRNERLIIRSNMIDAVVFIDGPHKLFLVGLGEALEISLSDRPLWLFDGPSLNENRKKMVERRLLIRQALS